MKLQIHVPFKDQRVFFGLLFSLGYTHNGGKDIESTLHDFQNVNAEWVYIREKDKSFFGAQSHWDGFEQVLSWESLFSKIGVGGQPSRTVKITDDCSAEVTADGVRIENFHFTFDQLSLLRARPFVFSPNGMYYFYPGDRLACLALLERFGYTFYKGIRSELKTLENYGALIIDTREKRVTADEDYRSSLNRGKIKTFEELIYLLTGKCPDIQIGEATFLGAWTFTATWGKEDFIWTLSSKTKNIPFTAETLDKIELSRRELN